MYAICTRRKRSDNPQQLRERAEKEFFPKLRQAPGFVSLTLIDGDDGESITVLLWQRREDAAAFQPEIQRWAQILDQPSPLISRGQGEVAMHVTPQTDRQG